MNTYYNCHSTFSVSLTCSRRFDNQREEKCYKSAIFRDILRFGSQLILILYFPVKQEIIKIRITKTFLAQNNNYSLFLILLFIIHTQTIFYEHFTSHIY